MSSELFADMSGALIPSIILGLKPKDQQGLGFKGLRVLGVYGLA